MEIKLIKNDQEQLFSAVDGVKAENVRLQITDVELVIPVLIAKQSFCSKIEHDMQKTGLRLHYRAWTLHVTELVAGSTAKTIPSLLGV